MVFMLYQSPEYYYGYVECVHKISISKKDYYPSRLNRTGNTVDMVYYIKGCDITRVGDKIYTNTADTIKIIPPFNTLDITSAVKSLEPGEAINIGYHSVNPFVTQPMVIDASGNPKLKNLFIKIHNVWLLKRGNYSFEAMSLFYQLMDEIINIVNSGTQKREKTQKLAKALEYIHEHYFEKNFGYNKLPSLCGLKHTQFNLIFQQALGTTPIKYITNLRMKLAVDMLVSHNFSITEIAEKTGYESVSYFSRVFSKNLGTVPSKYIESHMSFYRPENQNGLQSESKSST